VDGASEAARVPVTSAHQPVEGTADQFRKRHAQHGASGHVPGIVGSDKHATVAQRRRDTEKQRARPRPIATQGPRRGEGCARVAAGERPATGLFTHHERAHDVDERAPAAKVGFDGVLRDPGGKRHAWNDGA